MNYNTFRRVPYAIYLLQISVMVFIILWEGNSQYQSITQLYTFPTLTMETIKKYIQLNE